MGSSRYNFQIDGFNEPLEPVLTRAPEMYSMKELPVLDWQMMIFGKNEQWVTYDFMYTEQKSKRCQKTNLDCQFRLSAA